MDNQLSHRIDMIDALRGFAVLAILLLHSIEHFIFPVYPVDSPQWLNILDKGTFDIVSSLFAGKAYAIFALLFGFTFYIQCNNQNRKGQDFGYRFLWRLILLIAFATLNAAFFPDGDVLLLFVITGLVLFIVRNWSDSAVLLLAIFFILQPVEIFQYIMSMINPAYEPVNYNVSSMYYKVLEVTKGGNLWEFFLCNITLGQKASLLWAVSVGRMSQTAGLFLLGFYIGRKQLFIIDESNYRTWVKILITSTLIFTPLGSLKDLTAACAPMTQQTIGTVFDMWQKLSFTFILISSFVLLYQSDRFKKLTSNLCFYGRMSLTNYISQSIIGALIYFPIGLYLAPYCGYTLSVAIGIATFFGQLIFCKWWLKRHEQGPLEYVWHVWTWGRKNKK